MTRIVFHNVDEFASAVEGMIGQFMPTARSTNEWWMQNVSAGRLLIQTFQIGGQATFAGDGKRNQIALQIPLTDPTKIRVDGWPLEQDSFLLIREGHPFVLSTLETSQWVGIVVASDHELLAPDPRKSQISLIVDNRATSHVDAKAEHLDSIRCLANRLSAAANNTSFDVAGNRFALEQVIRSVSRMLGASSRARRTQVGRPSFSRGRIIARVIELFEGSAGATLSTDELCHAIGVAERTLRNIFQEYFGVGPIRFLKVRQLRAIREALITADPRHDTVTRIAERFGIWDFSLFARNYKALFGESPSESLRMASKRAHWPLSACDTWLLYASRVFSRKISNVVQSTNTNQMPEARPAGSNI